MSDALQRLTTEEMEAQVAQLLELEGVYAIRIERAERDMYAAERECAELDELLKLLREDLRRVEEQRRLWAERWQRWLDGGGLVHHGRSFTQRHAELGELERVLLQHQTEIGAQRHEVLRRVDAARAERGRLTRQRDALADKRRQLMRMMEARHESRQDEMAAELTLTHWHRQRTVETSPRPRDALESVLAGALP